MRAYFSPLLLYEKTSASKMFLRFMEVWNILKNSFIGSEPLKISDIIRKFFFPLRISTEIGCLLVLSTKLTNLSLGAELGCLCHKRCSFYRICQLSVLDILYKRCWICHIINETFQWNWICQICSVFPLEDVILFSSVCISYHWEICQHKTWNARIL